MANFIVLIVMATGCLSQESYTPALRKALRDGAKAKLTFCVLDEQGNPVTNATTSAYFSMVTKGGNMVKGATDENGLFVAEERCIGNASLRAEKNGYYKTIFKYNIQSLDPSRLKDGRWLPWNPTIPENGGSSKTEGRPKRRVVSVHTTFLQPLADFLQSRSTLAVVDQR